MSKAGWWAAGVMLVAVILMAGRSVFDRNTPPAPGFGSQPAAGAGAPSAQGASAVDLASMTPREAADRLFNRVMRGVSTGNSSEVEGFLPMAVAAYERAQPLDADGTFHLALLHLTGLDFAAAAAAVQDALTTSPNHLLLLSAAAEASVQAGDQDAASSYYERILEAWDEQVALELEEYQVHATMLPEIEADAREFLGQTP